MKTFAIVLLFTVVAYAKPANRIVGGKDAIVHEVPHEVSLQFRDPESGNLTHYCGGTILAKNFVITAAHCKPQNASDLKNVFVIAAAHDFSNKNEFEQTSAVASFVIHENYKGVVNPHDIGIIKLETPFNFTDKVKAATLPKKGFNATGTGTLSGWGYISKMDDRPKVLQKAVLDIYDDKKCHKYFPTDNYDDTNLCAGKEKGLPVACKGDSGSPFTQKEGNKTILVGVASWAYYPCGVKNKPTVFVEVAHYIDWIKKHMK